MIDSRRVSLSGSKVHYVTRNSLIPINIQITSDKLINAQTGETIVCLDEISTVSSGLWQRSPVDGYIVSFVKHLEQHDLKETDQFRVSNAQHRNQILHLIVDALFEMKRISPQLMTKSKKAIDDMKGHDTIDIKIGFPHDNRNRDKRNNSHSVSNTPPSTNISFEGPPANNKMNKEGPLDFVDSNESRVNSGFSTRENRQVIAASATASKASRIDTGGKASIVNDHAFIRNGIDGSRSRTVFGSSSLSGSSSVSTSNSDPHPNAHVHDTRVSRQSSMEPMNQFLPLSDDSNDRHQSRKRKRSRKRSSIIILDQNGSDHIINRTESSIGLKMLSSRVGGADPFKKQMESDLELDALEMGPTFSSPSSDSIMTQSIDKTEGEISKNTISQTPKALLSINTPSGVPELEQIQNEVKLLLSKMSKMKSMMANQNALYSGSSLSTALSRLQLVDDSSRNEFEHSQQSMRKSIVRILSASHLPDFTPSQGSFLCYVRMYHGGSGDQIYETKVNSTRNGNVSWDQTFEITASNTESEDSIHVAVWGIHPVSKLHKLVGQCEIKIQTKPEQRPIRFWTRLRDAKDKKIRNLDGKASGVDVQFQYEAEKEVKSAEYTHEQFEMNGLIGHIWRPT